MGGDGGISHVDLQSLFAMPPRACYTMSDWKGLELQLEEDSPSRSRRREEMSVRFTRFSLPRQFYTFMAKVNIFPYIIFCHDYAQICSNPCMA